MAAASWRPPPASESSSAQLARISSGIATARREIEKCTACPRFSAQRSRAIDARDRAGHLILVIVTG